MGRLPECALHTGKWGSGLEVCNGHTLKNKIPTNQNHRGSSSTLLDFELLCEGCSNHQGFRSAPHADWANFKKFTWTDRPFSLRNSNRLLLFLVGGLIRSTGIGMATYRPRTR